VEPIAEALDQLGILLYWVDGDGARPDEGTRLVPEGERDILPTADVEASVRDHRLQRRHPIEDGVLAYEAEMRQAESEAAKAGCPVGQLEWIYFRSPGWTWRHLCGREGWLLLDSGSNRQHAFIETVIN